MENYAEKKLIRFSCFRIFFMIIFYEKNRYFLALLCHFPALFNLYIHLVCVEKIFNIFSSCTNVSRSKPKILVLLPVPFLYILALSLWQGQKKIFLLALSLSLSSRRLLLICFRLE